MQERNLYHATVKAIESVLSKGDLAEVIPVRCTCGKLIAKKRGGKIFLWCKECHREVELKIEKENRYEPRADGRI